MSHLLLFFYSIRLCTLHPTPSQLHLFNCSLSFYFPSFSFFIFSVPTFTLYSFICIQIHTNIYIYVIDRYMYICISSSTSSSSSPSLQIHTENTNNTCIKVFETTTKHCTSSNIVRLFCQFFECFHLNG